MKSTDRTRTARTRTTTTRGARIAATTAALAGAALVLTGCGGNSDDASAAGGGPGNASESAPAENVYQFDQARVDDSDDQEPYVSSEGELVVTLSDDLAAALPDGSAVAVEQFTLTTTAFSTGVCRLDVEMTYTDGGLDFLSEPRRDPANSGDFYDESPEWFVLKALTDERLAEEGIVDALPADNEIAKDATYLTSDFSHATFVDDCSEDGEDSFVSLALPYSDGPNSADPERSYDSLPAFADVDVAVVAGSQGGSDGSSMIITGDTEAEFTATGQWAPPEY